MSLVKRDGGLTMSVKDKVLELLNETNREGMAELWQFLSDSDFFTAPASTRFHGNYEGALAEHSLNVTTMFLEKNEKFNLGLSRESCIICGLMHDMCKIGLYGKEVKWRKDKNDKWESYEPYTTNDTFPIGHGEKSVIMLQQYIKLTNEEITIIRWHMGGFVAKDDHYFLNKAIDIVPAIVALYTADMESSTFLEKTVII